MASTEYSIHFKEIYINRILERHSFDPSKPGNLKYDESCTDFFTQLFKIGTKFVIEIFTEIGQKWQDESLSEEDFRNKKLALTEFFHTVIKNVENQKENPINYEELATGFDRIYWCNLARKWANVSVRDEDILNKKITREEFEEFKLKKDLLSKLLFSGILRCTQAENKEIIWTVSNNAPIPCTYHSIDLKKRVEQLSQEKPEPKTTAKSGLGSELESESESPEDYIFRHKMALNFALEARSCQEIMSNFCVLANLNVNIQDFISETRKLGTIEDTVIALTHIILRSRNKPGLAFSEKNSEQMPKNKNEGLDEDEEMHDVESDVPALILSSASPNQLRISNPNAHKRKFSEVNPCTGSNSSESGDGWKNEAISSASNEISDETPDKLAANVKRAKH